MRDNLRRVCVVLPEDLIRIADEHKVRFHGSRSQLVRQAILEYVENLNGEDGGEAKMRPFMRKLEDLKKSVRLVESTLMEQEGTLEFLVETLESSALKAARDVERVLLERGEALSIPEMGDYLPQYEQSELIEAVERLEDSFSVIRVERKNSLTKWKIRGA